ncbi:MAG: methionine synthase [Bacillota bacterium]
MEQTIIAAAIGDCVHVTGVLNFLKLAEAQGYRTIFLGPAVPVEKLAGAAKETGAQTIAVGYRLGRRAAAGLFEALHQSLARHGLLERRLVFGGTPTVAEVAVATGLFDRVFSGREAVEDIVDYLRGTSRGKTERQYAGTLVERLQQQAPRPLIRHHFGLPSLEETVQGIEHIAGSGEVDIISIGPDQNAQEHFFEPEEMDPLQDGAGGVPVRSTADFDRIYQASRRGNYPLLRCYSGTRRVLDMARVLYQHLHNAWAAVPLFWYNQMDGRSERPLPEAIRENQEAMAWHGQRGIPVEVNEAHHWSLRGAHDTVAVAAAFLAAYNAKQAGVRHYIAQFMLNTPPGTSIPMDMAKMLAKQDLIESLAGPKFQVYRQVRAGLASFPPDLDLAKGHLASSTHVGMALRPHIVHVVAYCEAIHVARPEDVVASCRIARGAIANCLGGVPEVARDAVVRRRRQELLDDARFLLDHMVALAPPGTADPWADVETLVTAVKAGVLDAPQLRGNPVARGSLQTQLVDGACRAVDPVTGGALSEPGRLRPALSA